MKMIIKILVFSGFTYLILWILNYNLRKAASLIYIQKPSFVINCKDKHFDYLLGGSSRAHNNFNVAIFDSLSGKNGFNIGYGGSALAQNYITLYLFLKNGNSTKNYVQQIEDNFLVNPRTIFDYPFQDYFFLSNTNDSEIDQAFMLNVPFIKFYLWKYIPFIKYSEFNNYYSLKNLLHPPKTDKEMLDLKGYSKLTEKNIKDFPAKSYPILEEEKKVDSLNIFYLEKIRKLCKENNIKLIFYSSPIYQPKYLSYKPKNLHNALTDYVTQHNITYINFMQDNKYITDTLFYDETHLNSIGTDIFTQQLADSLKTKLWN